MGMRWVRSMVRLLGRFGLRTNMPAYLYVCACGLSLGVVHSLFVESTFVCECGALMFRKPATTAVIVK